MRIIALLFAACLAFAQTSEHEITQPGDLLTSDGQIREPGWGRRQMLNYNKENIKAIKTRIKEWDYYGIFGHGRQLVITISDVGYIGMISAGVESNFVKGSRENTKMFHENAVRVLSNGNMNLPRDIMNGTIDVSQGKAHAYVKVTPDGKRILRLEWSDFGNSNKDAFIAEYGSLGMMVDLEMYHSPQDEHIMVATPFTESKHDFYFNQKINVMRVTGTVIIGAQKFVYSENDENPFYCVLDWGRGVWPYSDSWIWASASGKATMQNTDGSNEIVDFGLNMGEGFGNLSSHSENAFFINGKVHKFGKLYFSYDNTDWYKPWTIKNADGTLNLTLDTWYVLATDANVGVLRMNSHQCQGAWTGTYTYPDGRVLKINEVIGFSEYVANRW